MSPVCRRRSAAVNAVLVEHRVQRVAGDVGHAARDVPVGSVRDERLDGEPTEGALVDEPQLPAVIGEPDPHAKVRLRWRLGRLHDELAAHPEVRHEAVVRWQVRQR